VRRRTDCDCHRFPDCVRDRCSPAHEQRPLLPRGFPASVWRVYNHSTPIALAIEAEVDVVHPAKFDEKNPRDQRRAVTLALLQRLNGSANPNAIREIPAEDRRAIVVTPVRHLVSPVRHIVASLRATYVNRKEKNLRREGAGPAEIDRRDSRTASVASRASE